MSALVDALAKTISLLFEIAISGADAVFKKIKPAAKTYLKSILITTLVWLALIPALVILKAATGWAVFGYLAAVLAIMLTAALGLLYAPLGLLLGMLAGKTVNPAEAGERYLRFFGPVIFAVLMGSLYLARVPIEKNMEAVPVLFIAVAAVAIGSSIWGSWLSGRFYTFVAIVIMSLTTLSFFLPKTFETIAQKFRNMDTDIAKLMGYRGPAPTIYSEKFLNYDTVEEFLNNEGFLDQIELEDELMDEVWAETRSEAGRDSIIAYNYSMYKVLTGLRKSKLSPRNITRLDVAIRANIERAARFR